jgi:hypothetical protein
MRILKRATPPKRTIKRNDGESDVFIGEWVNNGAASNLSHFVMNAGETMYVEPQDSIQVWDTGNVNELWVTKNNDALMGQLMYKDATLEYLQLASEFSQIRSRNRKITKQNPRRAAQMKRQARARRNVDVLKEAYDVALEWAMGDPSMVEGVSLYEAIIEVAQDKGLDPYEIADMLESQGYLVDDSVEWGSGSKMITPEGLTAIGRSRKLVGRRNRRPVLRKRPQQHKPSPRRSVDMTEAARMYLDNDSDFQAFFDSTVSDIQAVGGTWTDLADAMKEWGENIFESDTPNNMFMQELLMKAFYDINWDTLAQTWWADYN